ncbi:phosphatidylethanolamine-binding protein [Schizophyllum fasciatum]
MQLATLYAALFTSTNNSHRSPLDDVRDAFYRARIVPDVLPAFDPALEVVVEFPTAVVGKPGRRLSMKETGAFPRFVLDSQRHDDMFATYVLAVVDPGAYHPDDPTVAQVRHFLGANYTVGVLSGDGVGRSADGGASRFIRPHARTPWTAPITNPTGPVTECKSPAPRGDSDAHRRVVLAFRQPPGLTHDMVRLTSHV